MVIFTGCLSNAAHGKHIKRFAMRNNNDLTKTKRTQTPYLTFDLDPDSRSDEQCPLPDHQDSNPSFSIFKDKETGFWRWKCRGCDRKGTIVDLVKHMYGLDNDEACRRTLEQFGTGSTSSAPPQRDDRPDKKYPEPADEDIEWTGRVKGENWKKPRGGLYVPDGDDFQFLSFHNATSVHTQTCKYPGIGVRAFAVVRWDDVSFENREDESKVIRPCLYDGDRWRPGIRTDHRLIRPLYKFDEFEDWETIVVVEGEKCMDYLQDLVYDHLFKDDVPMALVTTNIGGANAVPSTDWSVLGDEDVLLIPDTDAEGVAWAHKIGLKLDAQKIQLYDDFDDHKGDDIVDWHDQDNNIFKLFNGMERENPVEHSRRQDVREWEPARSDKNKLRQAARQWLETKLESERNPFLDELMHEVAVMYLRHGEKLLFEAKKVVREETDLTKQQTNRKWEKEVMKIARGLQAERKKERGDIEERINSAGKPTHIQIARQIRDDITSESSGVAPVYDEGALWAYNPELGRWERIYEPKAYEGPLSQRIHDLEGTPVVDPETLETHDKLKVSSSYVDGVLTTLCRESEDNEWPHPFFKSAPTGVVFEDIFVQADLERRELVKCPHRPEHAQRVSVEFPFDRDANCPRFDQYLETVFAPDSDEDAKIALVEEILGAGLFGLATTSVAGRAFMLCGEGGTGKSTFLEILEALVPDKRVSQVPPQDFGDMGTRASLRGSRLNVVKETPASEVLKESGFKSIVHGETVMADKKYQPRFDFQPVALHVFACNELPDCPDTTDAYWDRWHGLTFNRRFRDTDDEINNLVDKIVENAMPGVYAHAIAGAERLLEKEGYTWPKSSCDMISKWRQDGNSVRRFLDECTTEQPIERSNKQTWEPSSKVWEAWGHFRKEEGHTDLRRKRFQQILRSHGYERGKSGIHRWSLQLKPEWADKVEQ
jgi:putative DNA primase/helicase